MPSAFFWFGQITNQTLAHMIVPSQAPMPIDVNGFCSVSACTRYPFIIASKRPRMMVAMAAQRNQKSAVGAITLLTAGF